MRTPYPVQFVFADTLSGSRGIYVSCYAARMQPLEILSEWMGTGRKKHGKIFQETKCPSRLTRRPKDGYNKTGKRRRQAHDGILHDRLGKHRELLRKSCHSTEGRITGCLGKGQMRGALVRRSTRLGKPGHIKVGIPWEKCRSIGERHFSRKREQIAHQFL